MNNQTFCELFILALLGIACARIFFTRAGHQDFLSPLPLIAFLSSVLCILAFGVSPFGVLLCLLAFFVALWNTNALSRFSHRLVLDNFSTLFTLSSIINLILVIVLGVFVVLKSPAKISTKKYAVQISTQAYAGTVDSGFFEYTSPAQRKSVFINKYVSKDERFNPFDESRTIVFVPSELSRTENYEPFLVKLAHDGYTVYSVEFYTKDLRWFNNLLDIKPLRYSAMIFSKLKKPDAYKSATTQKTENFAKEIIASLNLIPTSKSDKIFIVGDGESQASYTTAKLGSKKQIAGSFDLSTIPSYSTSGYGPIESTAPIVANLLGLGKDKTFYMSSHIAGILEKSIDESILAAKKSTLPRQTENPKGSETTEETVPATSETESAQ